VSGEAVEAAFAASRGAFDQVVGELSATSADAMTHSQLEEVLQARMRQVTRILFQDHLDLRALREQRVEVVADAEGIERNRIERGRARSLSTLFGKVSVTRFAYRGDYVHDLHPADARLNLPAGIHSHGVAKLAAIEASRGSFEDAWERINTLTGAGVGKRQVGELAVAAAADIDAYYAQLVVPPATDDTLLVLSCDGKGVVIRPEALREDTAKAAAAQGGHKMATRLSAGEKNGRKRMATLGAVYDTAPAVRGVDDIIADPEGPTQDDPARRDGPKASGKWLTGSVAASAAEVVKAVFDQAASRDPDRRRTWIVLVDGARHQLELIHAEARRRKTTVRIIVDFIHVLEYLWGAAWCLHTTDNSADAEAWVTAQARLVLAGGAEQVAAAITTAAEKAKLPATKRKGADDAVKYLRGKHEYLRYNTALASGWPIATGVIEGACRPRPRS
jgi:hypothetical protein